MYPPDIDRVELVERTHHPDLPSVQYDFGLRSKSEWLKIAYDAEKDSVSIYPDTSENGDISELEFTLKSNRTLEGIWDYIHGLKERLTATYAAKGLQVEVIVRISETYFGTPA